MEFSARCWLCVYFMISIAGFGCEAKCTIPELKLLLQCARPYTSQILLSGIGMGFTCDRSQITSDLCSAYGNIVTCVDGAGVSNSTCRPSMINQVNQFLVIPCKVEDFQAVCTSAPPINTGNNGSRVKVTLPTLMTSLMTLLFLKMNQ